MAFAASVTGLSFGACGQSIVCDEATAIPAPISTDIGFGRQVAASGNRAIVGRYGDVSVSILDLDTNLELYAIEPGPVVSSSGGTGETAVDIDADRAIVGVPGEDSAGADAGAVFLFDVTTGSQLFKLTAADAALGLLTNVLNRLDGDPQIPDWLMPSDEAEFASGGIQFVLAAIGG
ncbi:MAG: hypothetical protein KDA22_14750 [Phycisphaerales bacterium]|nr:hypothetical protein [Phycisphaerales bacterium]